MGQIRRFTGNGTGLRRRPGAGNIIVAQAYSGDIVQLQQDNPDLQFVVPEAGSTTFLDTMVIPYTTQNQKAAEEWINYIYDRANYAKLIAFTQYVPVLSDMTEELDKIDPKLGGNPLINPPKETLEKLTSWPPLTDEQTQEFNKGLRRRRRRLSRWQPSDGRCSQQQSAAQQDRPYLMILPALAYLGCSMWCRSTHCCAPRCRPWAVRCTCPR